MTGYRIVSVEIIGGKEALHKAVEKAIKESDKFKLYDVVVTSDHASYIEYGTGPANPAVPGVSEFLQSAKDKIYMWASLKPKFAMMTPAERKKIANATYKKVMEKGITAHPFMRPAIHHVMNNENLTERFEQGMTMEGFANLLADKMREIVWDEDIYCSGVLMDSIQVVEAETGRADSQTSIEDEQRKKEWDAESYDVKYGGKRT